MKKSNVIILLTLGTIVFFFLCFQFTVHSYVQKGAIDSSGSLVSEFREVSDFSQIDIDHHVHVFFTQDSISEVKVIASKNLMPFISTKNIERVLEIKKTKRTNSNDSIVIYISNSHLEKIMLRSGVSFETKGIISGDTLLLDLKDNSKAALTIAYSSVQCQVTSEALLQLKGDIGELEFLKE